MSDISRPEFSRVIPLARLGPEPFRQEIAATEPERAALARRFGLIALDQLTAQVELRHERGGSIMLRAAFEATFTQESVVSLEPVPGTLAESFALRYGDPEAEGEPDPEDEAAFEPLTDDAIDIGEAVAQEFSLALPPFPRTDADDLTIPQDPETEVGPLADLAEWLESRRG